MSATGTPFPDPIRPFRQAFLVMISVAQDLLERLAGARTQHITTYIPKRMARDIPTAEKRMNRALNWIWALMATLVGDTTYLLPPGTTPPTPRARHAATPRPQEPVPALDPCWTDEDDYAALTRRMQRVFATAPVNVIVKTLARRLGIREDSTRWPRALMDITETPAAWAERTHRAPPDPTLNPALTAPDPIDPDPITTQTLDPNPTPQPPFHRRE